MKHSVKWMHAGLPQDGPWSELFHLNLVYGSMTTQIMPRVYTAEEIARIKAPTLLIVGDRERIYQPRNVIAAAEKQMPAIRVAVIPEAHHIAAVAQPHRVSAQLTAFFLKERKFAQTPLQAPRESVLSH
jgi:pimeloyl-ACP methyl ester carboxylesterase